ncbi:sulfatase family protein [Maribacter ulvicola]|uniref:sulfatase family protein n=1 Tax=Maribacter ulvicola TaxID=228959 RepID=UPI000970800C|nr:sulfatase [Maribacter ulvicola]
MNNKILYVIYLSLFFVSCKSISKEEIGQEEGEHPNIIIIFTDDQGYADVGSYGAKMFDTPNIDSLASAGIRFTDFYAAASVCTPSRAALLTGCYPKRVGLHESVLRPYSKTGLSSNEYTMANMLSDAGYQTACVGKWHLGHHTEFMPNNQGFDYYFGVPYSNDMDSYYYSDVDFKSPPLPLYENRKEIESGPDQRYLTKRFTDKAINFIEDQEGPFFLYLAHIMPHVPLSVSENFQGKSAYGIYGDVITEIDWNVGRLVSFLKDKGIYDNTIIVFTSDNGPHRAKQKGSAKPLRGWKTETWEGGFRVPGIISWPAKITPNVVSDEVVTTMDLLPTFSKIVHGNVVKERSYDGRDLSAYLYDTTINIEDSPFYYYGVDGVVEAVRLGKWKLHVSKNKRHSTDEKFPLSLYNLEKDVGETINKAEDYPEIVEKLQGLIHSFDKKITLESRPVGKIDY